MFPRNAARRLGCVLTGACLFLAACREAERTAPAVPPRLLSTWAATGERAPELPEIGREALPPADAVPWAGTVSHHLLAGALIDDWCALLAQRRRQVPVETFFIVSPSHYGLSTQTWSLDDCAWDAGEYGTVCTDGDTEAALSRALGVPYDPQVFPVEHGVSTLIPFIAKYFPRARVCAIAVQGEPPLDQLQAQRLAEALSPYFDAAGKERNFLLISTDFAHHGDRAGTEFKDTRSRLFFSRPSDDTWIFCGCDNRPGIYVLSRFCQAGTAASVLYHTDSCEISGGQGADDITSYFFTFLYDQVE